MKWQCALLQRWLPEYPDGDLPAFWKARLRSHLEHCGNCRQELAALQGVVEAIKASPVADPGPEFWGEFSRELHLKLAQAAQESQAAPEAGGWKFSRIGYILGVPALAVLLLWAITYIRNPERPVLTPQPQVAQQGAPAPAEGGKVAEAPKPPAPEQFTYVTMENNGVAPDEDQDLSSWDLDSVLSGMTEQEKEAFLKKLHYQKKDGSCLERFSSVYWA